jgi:hypothetical protein
LKKRIGVVPSLRAWNKKGLREEVLDTERVKNLRTRRMQAELILAKSRDDVIEKALIEKQAAYLLVALRQKILTIPQTYSRRLLGLSDVTQMNKFLKEMAIDILNEIKDLPQKVVDPHWLEELEKD